MFIPSNQVNIFPTAIRNNEIDFKSKLNTEDNIVGFNNRLAWQSYIINGLDIEENDGNYNITEGECVINGYYFKLSFEDFTIDNEPEPVYIYFEITIEDIETPYLLGNTFNTKELVCKTEKDGEKYTTLDTTIDNSNVFKGLEIKTTSNKNDFSDDRNCLLIAQKMGGVWVKPNESQIIKENPIIIDDGEIK